MPMHSAQRAPAPPRRASKPGPAPAQVSRAAPAATGLTGLSRGPCACGGSCPRCAQAARRLGAHASHAAQVPSQRAGLAVSRPGDAAEREADQIAQQVLATPAAASGASASEPAAATRRSLDAGHLQAAPAHVRSALGDGGRALDEGTRAAMESRFGARFDHVRLHTGGSAALSAERLGARAYTLGQHVVVGGAGLQPGSAAGERLLAHELAHVVQQTGGAGGMAGNIARRAMSIAPMIQRDLAIEPPNPTVDGRVLTPDEIAAAITFNEGVLNSVPNSAEVIELVRDVIGASPTPAVIDQEFVEFVVDWQASFGLTQDGKLGPTSAKPLFREIGAEGAGKGQVKSGPRYNVAGPVNIARAGTRQTTFTMFAEFDSDPANGILPSCCEVRQDLQWDAAWRAASVAAGTGAVPTANFPAAHPAGTFIEDRDAAGRYGHRAPPFTDPGVGDQYLDTAGRQNQAFGHIYRGSDSPLGFATDRGSWTFRLRVIDVCDGGKLLAVSRRLVLNWL